jgi:hypothetical protein
MARPYPETVAEFEARLWPVLPGPFGVPLTTVQIGELLRLDAYQRSARLYPALCRLAKAGRVSKEIARVDGRDHAMWRRVV